MGKLKFGKTFEKLADGINSAILEIFNEMTYLWKIIQVKIDTFECEVLLTAL